MRLALHQGSAISAVNLAEVVTQLSDRGMPRDNVYSVLDGFRLEVVPFDEPLAYETGFLRPATRSAGLSLGDRACLALGLQRRLPVLTTERAWAALGLPVDVRVLR